MEQTYENRKKQLLDDLSNMSEIAEEMLQNAIKALDEKDVSLAKDVINRDDVLDNYQVTIEEEVSRLLSLDKPLTSDVYNNVALVKIAGDLERVGDLATDIADTVLELKNEEYLEPLVMIPELANTVSDMLDTVLEAFVTRNADLAEAVCRKDEVADNIYDKIYGHSIKLINESEGTRNINQVIQFLNIAKSLERIGDHATNIGEETIFIVTGKRVKY
ncbi:phosphate signaling complex protein PhoU [Halothermothrix orenii]|uniref:Phosphate-specific transport system accessory protein PhoU n=1 Tax=Halothermothrix orenii (strain H 168 / OCM 544 / DSM 9562) TaxID=373903 RepID=B8CZG2_HALOH|nr:phosphate signaling complex protein PhoU [Halothermothrix orenii]ACL70681.1 phosphate uptake regulator, PhoU [Halothermothrix orenii H 168]